MRQRGDSILCEARGFEIVLTKVSLRYVNKLMIDPDAVADQLNAIDRFVVPPTDLSGANSTRLLVSVEKNSVLFEPTRTASLRFVASSNSKSPTFRSKVEATFSSS